MKKLIKSLQDQFDLMCNTGKLFRSSISGDKLWDKYLNSFPEEYDPIFRSPESSSHNCNNCKNFIRNYGNIIAYDKDYNVMTLWDFIPKEEYRLSVKAVKTAVLSRDVSSVFIETYNWLKDMPYSKCRKLDESFQVGIKSNFKQYTPSEVIVYGKVNSVDTYEFNHLHLFIPNRFIDKSEASKESIIAEQSAKQQVFYRGLNEITLDSMELVVELINSNAILNGTTYLDKLNSFIEHKKEFDQLDSKKKLAYSFLNLDFNARFKNELIGILCSEIISDGIEKACLNWNKRVDPVNYKKASAPVSKKQIEEAKKFVSEMGYEESFERRCATIDDISAHEILHINEGETSNVSIFDKITATQSPCVSDFSKIPEININEFMENILPNCKSIEAYVSNDLVNNFVTITTSANKDSKRMFGWDNNFGWTYNGNLSGKSAIKQAVESKGGRTDGVFRFSHSWNNIGNNKSLMDLHVIFPNAPEINHPIVDGREIHDNYPIGYRIGWNNRNDFKTKGSQDVDYTGAAPSGYVPVENITFPDINLMPEGVYTCRIHNWAFREITDSGFTAEIEFDGNIYEYIHHSPLRSKEWITVAEVTLKNGKFTIDHKIPTTKEVPNKCYGLNTNEFHNVNLVCKSPNHWGENKVGNLHYFFMLDKCMNENKISTFHPENLNSELSTHRKVIQLLGGVSKIDCTNNQLSGIGFNSTMKENVIVKVNLNNKTNIYNIKF